MLLKATNVSYYEDFTCNYQLSFSQQELQNYHSIKLCESMITANAKVYYNLLLSYSVISWK